MARGSHNPWKDQHKAGEMEYTGDGYSRRRASQIVDHEYDGAPDPLPCHTPGCTGHLHYRATVGAMMCPLCRAMAHQDGTVIR